MTPLTDIAEKFFDACDTGKGWDSCSTYCNADATFSAQASPLSEVKTLAQYTDWMKGMMGLFPDGRYELKSFATDRTGAALWLTRSFMEPLPGKVVQYHRPVDA